MALSDHGRVKSLAATDQRVGEAVKAGEGPGMLWHGHDEGRVNDCDLRSQFVVSQRVLDMLLVIGDDGVRGDF